MILKSKKFPKTYTYSVSDWLAVEIYFFVQQFKKTRWEKLEILDVRLFWRSRCFWCFGLANTQGLSKISIHSVVCLSLTLWRFNPTPQSAQFVLFTVVLTLKLVYRVWGVHCKGTQTTLPQSIQLFLQLICLKLKRANLHFKNPHLHMIYYSYKYIQISILK